MFEIIQPIGTAQLSQRLCVYLPYSLTGNAKALSDFFKCQTVFVTEVQNAPLALCERVQDVFQRTVEIAGARIFPLAAEDVVQQIVRVG